MTVGPGTGVTFDVLKEAYRKILFGLLDEKDGAKMIIWDADLVKPFTLLTSFKELEKRGVSNMFTLQRGPLPVSAEPVQHVVFITRPQLARMEMIAENLRCQRPDDNRQLHLVFTPRQSVACENKLEEVDSKQKFTSISVLPAFFYQWDVDLVSMEEASTITDYIIHEDKSCLHSLVMGLVQIERCYGPIDKWYYKGNLAQDAFRLLQRERQKQIEQSDDLSCDDRRVSLIDSAVIFDRMVDPLTPYVTQLTYEGLIDEIYGIKCATSKFPKAKFVTSEEKQNDPKGSQEGTATFALNSNEELFQDLRDLNFNSVPATLSAFIKSISQEQETRHNANLHEMKEFVKRLPLIQAAKKSAAIHMAIAELIKDETTSERFIDIITAEHEILNEIEIDKPIAFVETGIARGEPWQKMLRLICLQCLVADGLPPKVLDQYRRDFLQSYGYHMLPLLCKLQKANILRPKSSGGNAASNKYYFSGMKKIFRLLVEDVKEQNPNDLSYVYSGYAPLTIRLCSYLIKPGWKLVAENLKRAAGATGIEEENTSNSSSQSALSKRLDDKRTILVAFIGGVTLAEISALRFLAKHHEDARFLILTTGIVNGYGFLEAFS